MAISVENHKIFPLALYFAPQLKGFPLELGTGGGVRTLEWWATRPRKKFDDIFSHLDTMHQQERRTDTGRQTRPCLHIESCG